MWVLVAAVLAAGALLAPAVIDAMSRSDSGAPTYPEVPGELGDVLRDLQESVE
jgi:hypothetical protein